MNSADQWKKGAFAAAMGICLLFANFTSSASAQQPTKTQTIVLRTGWNLISIQVGAAPIPVATFRALMNDPNTSEDEGDRLIEIWGYSSSGNPLVPGTWQSYQPRVPEFPSDLTNLQQGRGYWVNVGGAGASVPIAGPRWDGSVSLLTGWNLVGFPGIDLATDEAQEISSVFGTSFGRIQQVWTFDKTLGRFSGYDITAIPALKELNLIQPAKGYWVYAIEPVAVTPQPYVALPGDADASPLETEVPFNAADFPTLPNPADYAGTNIRKVRANSEDVPLDLNGNGIIDGPFTQNVLKFEVGVDRQTITIGNNGTGLANWVLDNNIPWLFTASSDSTKWPAGTTSRPKTASGVVSSDRDTITLYVDTTGLAPGTQTGTMTLFLGTLVKTLTVKLDVPTAAGDWKGFATTQRVNGKNIGIGAVDMGLNLFMASDATNETSFRAVLNQDKSLLFPRDIFLNGVFYSGNNFSITTNFQMDAGDRNAPPYDTFAHVPDSPPPGSTLSNSQSARADKDYNGNHKLDVDNPFPFSIHRQITLLGQRINPNRMEGSYIESLEGMLPNSQPIFIEGTFFLDRQTLAPTKKSIFNGTSTNPPITIGSSTGSFVREFTLNVTSPVSVQGVTVTLNMTFPDPSVLTVYLEGPNGQRVYLARNSSALGTTYTLTDFNGFSGQGAWKLHIEWSSTPLRGTFTNWSLNVQGLATYSIAGKIVNSGAQTLAGVHAILSGSNVLKQTDTGVITASVATTSGSKTATLTTGNTSAFYEGMPVSGNAAIPVGATVTGITGTNTFTLSLAATGAATNSTTFGVAGKFVFNGLTENNYTVTLTKPGYVSRTVSFYLNNANYYIGHGGGLGVASTTDITASDPVIMDAETATAARLDAAPYIGAEALSVNFSLVLPLSTLPGLGSNVVATWNFGDGTPAIADTADANDDITLSTAKHLYQTAGDYTATVTLTGSSNTTGAIPVATPIGAIHVQRVSPDTRPGASVAQVIGAGFIGSFAARLDTDPPSGGSPVQVSSPGTTTQQIIVPNGSGGTTTVALSAIQKGIVYQESKRDSASFDIDRSPFGDFPIWSWARYGRLVEPSGDEDANGQTNQAEFQAQTASFAPSLADSDFTGQLYVYYDGAYPTTIFDQQHWITRVWEQGTDPASDNSPGTFSLYQLPSASSAPDRFRMITTLGGAVFSESTPIVGDLQLQVGRIEP